MNQYYELDKQVIVSRVYWYVFIADPDRESLKNSRHSEVNCLAHQLHLAADRYIMWIFDPKSELLRCC